MPIEEAGLVRCLQGTVEGGKPWLDGADLRRKVCASPLTTC
jgi:hypothetical protein